MSTVETWLIDAGERAGKTIVQIFSSTLLTLGVALNWTNFWHALDVALLAGVVSLITSVVSIPISKQLTPVLQVLLRALLTFGQSALAYVAANTFLDLTSVRWLEMFQVALIATITSVVTSWASWNVGPVKGNPSAVHNTAPVAPVKALG
jgi:hypothetical protein